MGHIFYENKEIPVPDGARSNGYRVYVDTDIGGGNKGRIYIGVYARKEDNMFYPNSAFRYYYPRLWEQHYGTNNLPQHQLSVGLYATVLAIGHRTSLYQTIYDVFGPLYGNALMDFAMYSIKERSNVINLFKPSMSSSVLFSKDRMDDEWYESMLNNVITREHIWEFKIQWLSICKKRGISKVWLCGDGSNSNCEISIPLAKKGKAKSHINIPIISSCAVGVEVGHYYCRRA